MTTHRVAWIGGIGSPQKIRNRLPAGCDLVGFCDIDEENLARARAEDPGILGTNDFRQVAAMSGCDTVIAFTPNETHRDIAVSCLEGGKNVFIEKPMGITLEQGREILDAERRSGKRVGVDLEFRCSRAGRLVREIIDSGELGDLLQVECDHHRGGWLNDTPQGQYRTKRGTSGLFKMEGIHMIDLMRYWAGEIERCRVFSAANALPQYEFADNCTVMIRFARGAQGRFTASHNKAAYSLGHDQQRGAAGGHIFRLAVVGTRGVVHVDFWNGFVNVLHFRAQPVGSDSLKPEFERRIDYSGLTHPAQAGHDMGRCRREFITRMAAGRPPFQPAEDAYRSEQIAFALDDCPDRDGGLIDCTSL